MADINSSLPVTDTADGTDGAAAPTNLISVGGTDTNGLLQALRTDATGRVEVKIVGNSDGTSIGNESSSLNVNVRPSLVADRSGSGNMGSLDTTVAANTQGMGVVNFNITGTWVGTIRAEGTLDGGTTWILLVGTGSGQGVFATTSTNDIFKVACAGFSQVRLRMSAYTSGTASAIWDAGVGLGPIQVWNTNSVSLKTEPRGNVASGATDSGNPIKVGYIYNSTQPTVTTGQRVDAQTNQFGSLSVQYRNSFRNLTGNATTTVKSGSGTLHSVVIANNASGGTVTIYDNTAGSGTVMFTFSTAGGLTAAGPFSTGCLGAEFSTGLTVVTAGSASNNVTILYR